MYVPKDWIELVTFTRDQGFIDLHYYQKTVQGISGMQLLHYEKANPNKLFYKTTFAEDIQPFQELSLRPQRFGKL